MSIVINAKLIYNDDNKRYDDDCLIKLVMEIGLFCFFFKFEFAMLVSDSLNVLRVPCSEASVWHAAYDEVLAVSLLSRKRPSLNREGRVLGVLLSHVVTLHGVGACTARWV